MADYPYLFEMHFHTKETSPCGNISAEVGVSELIAHGYSGVVVTDHYSDGFFDPLGDDWHAACEAWLKGYRAAKAAAPDNFTVLLGAEVRFVGSPNDYLVYGIDEAFLFDNPRLDKMTPEQFSALAERNGLFFAQAHPFRGYCTACDPALLDGVEVYNGNLRHQSHNDVALEFAQKNHLLMLSGSDFHEYEDTARGGMYFASLPTDERELVQLLRSGDNQLKRS